MGLGLLPPEHCLAHARYSGIVQETARLLSTGDPEAYASYMKMSRTLDCDFILPHNGDSIRGMNNEIDYCALSMQEIRDLRVNVGRITRTSRNTLQVEYIVSGTGSTSFFSPLFPAEKFVRWHWQAQIWFSRTGRIKRNFVEVDFKAKVPPQISQLEGIADSAVYLMSNEGGCRLLQRFAEVSGSKGHRALVSRLPGHVWELAGSVFPGRVFQKFIAIMDTEIIAFVVLEFAGRAKSAAQCRNRGVVLEAILEHLPAPFVSGVAAEVIDATPELCCHANGSAVVQKLFEFGTKAQRRSIVGAVVADVHRLCRHKHSINVVRRVFALGCLEDKALIAAALLFDDATFTETKRHLIGSFAANDLRREGWHLERV